MFLCLVFVLSELAFWEVKKGDAVSADDVVGFFAFLSSEVSYIAWFEVGMAELAVAHDEGVHVVAGVVKVCHRAPYAEDLVVAVRADD